MHQRDGKLEKELGGEKWADVIGALMEQTGSRKKFQNTVRKNVVVDKSE